MNGKTFFIKKEKKTPFDSFCPKKLKLETINRITKFVLKYHMHNNIITQLMQLFFFQNRSGRFPENVKCQARKNGSDKYIV